MHSHHVTWQQPSPTAPQILPTLGELESAGGCVQAQWCTVGVDFMNSKQDLTLKCTIKYINMSTISV